MNAVEASRAAVVAAQSRYSWQAENFPSSASALRSLWSDVEDARAALAAAEADDDVT